MKYLNDGKKAFQEKDYDKAIDLYLKAIDNKEYEACFLLGLIYLTGYCVEKNIDKGLDYLFLGDKHDEKQCISSLGDYYYNGKYLNKDLTKAKSYYDRAAKLLEPHAIGMLGLFLFNEEKYSEAIEYFRSGAMYYDTNSMYYMAKCAYNGLGMEKDLILGVGLYQKLYDYDCTNIEIRKILADAYFNGYGINQDYNKAKELYEMLDDDDSVFNLGLIYKNYLKEYDKAIECFKKVKNEKSQFEQALMLYNGLGMEENKNEAYFKFYACAMSKYAYSYPFIGDSYYYGYGVKKDYREAIKWYKEALKENIPNQNLNIGLSYLKLKKYNEALSFVLKEDDSINKYKTLGTIYLKLKDYPNMIDSYMKASDLNDIYSTYELYKIYKKGKGVKKDKDLANNYYLKYITLSSINNNEN